MPILPGVFVSHGAPTLLIDRGPAREFLTGLGSRLGRPSGVLVITAHWQAPGPSLSSAEVPETIHDFGGFPAELYRMHYPAPGAPALAERAAGLLRENGISARLDETRGLDHGAWVPLKLMYPAADIPVTSMSVLPNGGPSAHLRLGEALRLLRRESVLVLGSGALTHSLHDAFTHDSDDPPAGWIKPFTDWITDAINRDDRAALVDYRRRAPDAVRHHPTEEHLLPLFTAMGAGTPGIPGRRLHDSVTYGVLAMDVYAFD